MAHELDRKQMVEALLGIARQKGRQDHPLSVETAQVALDQNLPIEALEAVLWEIYSAAERHDSPQTVEAVRLALGLPFGEEVSI